MQTETLTIKATPLSDGMVKAKTGDTTDSTEEWLDEFNTFSIYQVLPEIIKLRGLNIQTEAEYKKNFAEVSGR